MDAFCGECFNPIEGDKTLVVRFHNNVLTSAAYVCNRCINEELRNKFKPKKEYSHNPRSSLLRLSVEEVVEALADGAAPAKLAKRLKVSRSTIYRRIKQARDQARNNPSTITERQTVLEPA